MSDEPTNDLNDYGAQLAKGDTAAAMAALLNQVAGIIAAEQTKRRIEDQRLETVIIKRFDSLIIDYLEKRFQQSDGKTDQISVSLHRRIDRLGQDQSMQLQELQRGQTALGDGFRQIGEQVDDLRSALDDLRRSGTDLSQQNTAAIDRLEQRIDKLQLWADTLQQQIEAGPRLTPDEARRYLEMIERHEQRLSAEAERNAER